MQLRNPVFCVFALFLTIFASNAPLAQTADLEEPIDTTDILIAKGGPNPLTITDADLRERLSYLSGCVEFRTTGVVKGYIKTYVQIKPEKAKIMLGKRLTYFPLFEAKLKEYGLPADLKYLAVVESALNPKAVSKVGATGLWQFMPATGSEYGLRTNSAVEDRSNPVKSTDAAARYLKELYRQFDDWSLALAAYNSGPGRVNAAIRKAGSRNFWKIMNYLPKETRNYVPAFIAATYICNYYQVHDLTPNNPDFDEQLTDHIRVYEGLSFRDISESTGIAYDVIRTLNPGFKRDYVPPTPDGHYVIVPQRVMPAFVRYLNTVGTRAYSLESNSTYVASTMGDGRYWKSTVVVKDAEPVEQFAKKLGCCGDHLKTWNRMSSNYVYPDQEIEIMHPVFVQKHSAGKIEAPVQDKTKPQGSKPVKAPAGAGKSNTNIAANNTTMAPPVYQSEERSKVPQYQYHTVRRNESLEDVARQYATSVESLRKLNGSDLIKFGMRLKIRQF